MTRRRLVWVLAAGAIAVGVVGLVVASTSLRICDEELTSSGQVVEVCRHLQVTDPLVALLGLLVVVGLGAFFSEVGAFGISLKRDVAQAKLLASNAEDTAQEAAGASESAAAMAEAAVELARRPPTERESNRGELENDIRSLATEYNAIRRDMRSGSERTSLMTEVVSKMIGRFSTAEAAPDLSALLSSEDRGLRLAGYAYLYTNPESARAIELASSVMSEDKPFSQYWGLQALRKQIDLDHGAIDLNTRRRLERLAQQLDDGTDRAHELRRILGSTPRG